MLPPASPWRLPSALATTARPAAPLRMRKRGSVGVGLMSHKLQARWPSAPDLVTGAMFGAQRDVASTQFVRDKNKKNVHGCDIL